MAIARRDSKMKTFARIFTTTCIVVGAVSLVTFFAFALQRALKEQIIINNAYEAQLASTTAACRAQCDFPTDQLTERCQVFINRYGC